MGACRVRRVRGKVLVARRPGSGWWLAGGLFLGWVIAGAAGVRAQTPATGAPSAEKPTSITLDVVARDHSGSNVTGLTQGDFVLLENQKARPVEGFRAIPSAGGDAGAPPVRVILLVDMVNTDFSRVAYERTEIDKFLRRNEGHLSQPTSLMLFSDTSVQTMVDASRDGNMLAQKLDGSDIALRTLRRSAGFYGAVDRFQLSVNTLLRIAQAEKAIPGRKVLVWISPGWPLLSGPGVQLTAKQEDGLFRTIVTASTALREANVTLYSVDPLGTADAGTLRTVYYKTFLKGVTEPKRVDIGDLGLEVLAVQSGGQALSSSNDVAALIEKCYADTRSYYELTFAPTPAEHADDYRAIAVKSEKPGITMQTRTGFYMQP